MRSGVKTQLRLHFCTYVNSVRIFIALFVQELQKFNIIVVKIQNYTTMLPVGYKRTTWLLLCVILSRLVFSNHWHVTGVDSVHQVIRVL